MKLIAAGLNVPLNTAPGCKSKIDIWPGEFGAAGGANCVRMSMLNRLLGVAVKKRLLKICVNPQPGLAPAVPGAEGNEAEGPASVISKIKFPPPLTKNCPTWLVPGLLPGRYCPPF